MNTFFATFVIVAFVVGAKRQLFNGDSEGVMLALNQAILDEAGRAITLALGLIGVMALFLGILKIAEAAGLLRIVSRLLQRPMLWLFPQVPADHPAMGAMVMNMSANMLGLGNAATPFGLKAMQALDRLNPIQGTATDSMVLFLAINTANVTLLPTSVIALRAAAGSADPAGVMVTTLFATVCSTVVAIVVAKLGARLWPAHASEPNAAPALIPPASADETAADADRSVSDARPYPMGAAWLAGLAVLGLAPVFMIYGRTIGAWLIPAVVTGLVVLGVVRRVAVYEVLVDGAREGFDVAVRIIPYLVAILVAIGMLRASGALQDGLDLIAPLTAALGIPPEGVLMALLRSLSGSGAYAYLATVLNDRAIGPDSYTGYLVSTIQGSTETTFYVLAVYCGAAGVRRMRHALLAGLAADVAGLAAAVFICQVLYGG